MEKSFGSWGEQKACEFLVKKGYKIVGRNVKNTWGELDIVTVAPDDILVFVEVKTMHDRGDSYLAPEDHMTQGKLERYRRAASLYAGSHGDLAGRSGWRMDVVTLKVRGDGDRSLLFEHYENV